MILLEFVYIPSIPLLVGGGPNPKNNPSPPDLVLRFGLWRGGAPRMDQGVGVGLGCAARSTSSTSRRKMR